MRKLKWTDIALLPFPLCVVFLRMLGKVCGLTYIQISVVFNLWLQGAVLTLSGLAPAAVVVYKAANGESVSWWIIAMLLAYAAVHVYGFTWMLRRYRLPFNDAFRLCVDDMQKLADKSHTTYQMANLVIFVMLFLVLLAANIGLTYYITQI